MSDIEERVAKAIEEAMFAEHELPVSAELHSKYIGTARAAIAAMPQGEPVAWQHFLRGWWCFSDGPPHPDALAANPDKFRPLYASPSLPVSEPGVREALDAMSLAVELLPRRKERIGGQIHSYVSLENVLAILEAQP